MKGHVKNVLGFFARNRMFIGGCVIVYILSIKGTWGNFSPADYGIKISENTPPLETSMERGRFAQVAALFENRSFNVDEFYGFLKPDLAWYNGHYFPAFPPGAGILALPMYAVGKMVQANLLFTGFSSSLAGLLIILVMARAGKILGLSKEGIIFMCLAFAFGSSAWAYGVSISAHLFSALAVIIAFYICLTLEQKTGLKVFLFGLTLGTAVIVDYPNAVIFIPFAMYVAAKTFSVKRTKKQLDIQIPVLLGLSGLLGLALVLGPYTIYSKANFGIPFAFTNAYNLKRISQGQIDYENPDPNRFKKESYATNFKLTRIPFGVKVLLLSTDRGLLYYSPVFLLAIPGIYLMIKRHRAAGKIILGALTITILFYAAFDDPWGGWAFGPRYLIGVLPMLAMTLGLAYERMKVNFWLKKVALIVLVGSMGINLTGALTTNAVPPSVEAKATGSKSNYAYNMDKLRQGETSSWFYGTFVPKIITPRGYFYGVWILMAAGTVFMLYRKAEKIRKE